MFSALFSHFILLLKGKHDLVGLPQKFGVAFLVLAIPAVVVDSVMNVFFVDLPTWFVILELFVPVGLVVGLGYPMASAMLVFIIFSDLLWLAISALAGTFGIELPFVIFLVIIGYLTVINVIHWFRIGLINPK